MNKYDSIIVGSGASGLTTALLLAHQGQRVLIIEKAPGIGGAMSRFRKANIPFDTGFHFTGGLNPNGFFLLDEMLQVLGLRDQIEPVILPSEKNHRLIFSQHQETFDLPGGIAANRQYLKTVFPREKIGIDGFFDRMQSVYQQTASMDLRHLGESLQALPEDWVSLQQVLQELIGDKTLQAVLATGCMCHGSRPSEISFAKHCRMAFGLFDSIARVKHGGDALVQAFARALEKSGVETRCKTEIVELAEINQRKVGRFVLSDGSEVTADNCVLTIHPEQILQLLPRQAITPAFINRVAEFKPSIGFFSIFGTTRLDNRAQSINHSLFSLIPDLDIERMMTPGPEQLLPMVMLGSIETVSGRRVQTVTAFEVSFREHVAAWQKTSSGRRGPDYLAYKKNRVLTMRQQLGRYHPWIHDDFKLLASSSMLTFRDYLNSPSGEAYGIRQKVGQFNLIGKLPLRNLFAAGQSAMLPGVLGAMASGFFVVRAVAGRNPLQKHIEKQLCR